MSNRVDIAELPPGAREAFKMVACPGGPILEIPAKGRFVYERLSPGTIREPDFYEEFRLITGGRPGTRLLVACPRGATRKGVCTVGQRVLRIWHSKHDLNTLLRRCRSGSLARDRKSAIRRINEDIDRLRRGLRPLRTRRSSFRGMEGDGIIAKSARVPVGRFLLRYALPVAAVLLAFKLVFSRVPSEEMTA